ncbi:uncharacterized protein LOC110858874 [Folsomia candida]|uniref:uncharacterized protein LOC110858874 n=1 Tax=Folsomia candida TaxID=158441 RepID=UPI000B907C12|nr:uncharacterized protein LOC110858874 [Folsomia candida]
MHDLDPEKDNHTPELYAVWNSKPWFQTVSETNPFNSTYFYWMDIGSVRQPGIVLTNFPSLEKSLQVFGADERSPNYHKLNIFAVQKLPNFKPPPDHNTFDELGKVNFVEGGFFGGTAASINWFSRTFYALHDYQLAKGEFVGKDQTLYNWMATKYPNRFRVVCDCMQVPRDCGDRWFYFQKWYAEEDESNEQCRNATVENMRDFLLMD